MCVFEVDVDDVNCVVQLRDGEYNFVEYFRTTRYADRELVGGSGCLDLVRAHMVDSLRREPFESVGQCEWSDAASWFVSRDDPGRGECSADVFRGGSNRFLQS